jgi:hypothetical protein
VRVADWYRAAPITSGEHAFDVVGFIPYVSSLALGLMMSLARCQSRFVVSGNCGVLAVSWLIDRRSQNTWPRIG